MKIWQLLACLSDEREIFKEYMGDIDVVEKGRDEADEVKVQNALKKSKKKYFVSPDNYLRLYTNQNGKIKKISISEAYKKYGGDAITEVIDYGSFNFKK